MKSWVVNWNRKFSDMDKLEFRIVSGKDKIEFNTFNSMEFISMGNTRKIPILTFQRQFFCRTNKIPNETQIVAVKEAVEGKSKCLSRFGI